MSAQTEDAPATEARFGHFSARGNGVPAPPRRVEPDLPPVGEESESAEAEVEIEVDAVDVEVAEPEPVKKKSRARSAAKTDTADKPVAPGAKSPDDSEPATILLPADMTDEVKQYAERHGLFMYLVLLLALKRHGKEVTEAAKDDEMHMLTRRRRLPRSSGTRLNTTAFRLTAEQKRNLDAAAEEANMSRAEFATRILRALLDADNKTDSESPHQEG